MCQLRVVAVAVQNLGHSAFTVSLAQLVLQFSRSYLVTIIVYKLNGFSRREVLRDSLSMTSV